MGDIHAIREGLATALGAIAGLRTNAYVPDSVSTPAAVVGGPDEVSFDQVFGRGADRFMIPVRLYAGRASERAGQRALDAYLSSAGAQSVKAALEADHTLGGVAHTCRVTRASGYGVYTVAGQDLLGVEFQVEVLA
jgi:hypothetical protein